MANNAINPDARAQITENSDTTGTGRRNDATTGSSNLGEGVADAMDAKSSKVLSVSANLAKLLPSGAVLVLQTLSASFTNQGDCNVANKWLSASLVAFLTAACIFLTFTDCIVHKGKIYYGVALPRRLNVFGLTKREERELLKALRGELKERRLKTLDWVHAFFTAIVFISIAMGDVGLQKCFVPDLDSGHMKNVKELLRNAPLGLALLSSFVFMIFPTRRRGVGFDNGDRGDTPPSEEDKKKANQQQSKENASTNV
ncbi:unnamed protein product [Miscanthus lutarioriparius]|uniref:Uncharacterized protein n=1 Tax=Miscanthus lutarioriparius TaxID=422564 RepID=A0A811SD15_9POAL|nr:unnamed protein product [Miscanthus lutarioriparius]